jgi:methylmalonyl-CoA/ethylmalonyl-CoA epimerase
MNTWKVHHLGVAVPDLQRGIDVYRDLFGYMLLSGPFDDPIQKVSVCFLGLGEPGEVAVELVTPNVEASPVNRVLTKDNTAYHICYEVEDVERALHEVRKKGCVIVSEPVPAVAFQGRRIAWFYTPTRQLVEVLEL